ncbi:hypothetical protein F5Y19DRAFT_290242 [Xylariaceae sp. FL1651]|nr:hypothetical protein F5Y19DRAFT_290242 [Xylariaceae sp. FL1651]
MASQLRTHNDYTVGWICALPKEQTAAIAMLDQRHPKLPRLPDDPNTYNLGSIGDHNIVITCLPTGKIGTVSAATVAIHMAHAFPSVKFGLMVGIGGGVSHRVRLGDVVVGVPTGQYPGVVQWDLGKEGIGGKFTRTGSLNKPPDLLLSAISTLQSEHDLEESKISSYLSEMAAKYPKLAPRYLRSESLEDILFKPAYDHIEASLDLADEHSLKQNENEEEEDEDEDEEEEEGKGKGKGERKRKRKAEGKGKTEREKERKKKRKREDKEEKEEKSCRYCDKTQIVRREARDIRIHYGLILSGNRVIKNATFRDNLRRDLGKDVLCVEMEAAGLMDNFPCIVIRGICDYADSHKNKVWQEHAAAVAAAYAKELLGCIEPNDVDKEMTVKDIINGVSSTVSAINEHVAYTKRHLEKKEDIEILNWLIPTDYGPQQTDYLKRREPGTGQWLLDSKEYQSWIQEPSKTLFCPGIPGAGKSILTSIVIDNLETRFRSDNTTAIAYIYCNYKRQSEQTVENLLLSLLKQLAQSQPSLPHSLKGLYDRHRGRQTRPSLEEVSRALESITSQRIFVIIDALDECQASDGCRMRFLSALFTFRERTGVSIFATSRMIPEIMVRFQGSLSVEIRATKDDIRRYLYGHIKQLPSFVTNQRDLQDEIVEGITKAVDGMFLLAQLHFDSLKGKDTKKSIRKALEKLATGSSAYDVAYKAAMERIEGQLQEQAERAKQVLSWITCAKRPLTTRELQHALAVEIDEVELDEDNLPQIEDVISICAGLVTIDEQSDVVRLVHYTTQDYFVQNQNNWFPNAQLSITVTCVTYLSYQNFASGYSQTDKEFEERLRSHPFYNYAACNWGHHGRNVSDCWSIISFLRKPAQVEASSQVLRINDYRYGQWDYSQKAPKQMTGLHLTAHFGLGEAVVNLLRDCDVNVKDSYNQTPLHLAAQEGHEAVVRLLLATKTVKPDVKDNYGRTPLRLAAQNGHEAVVRLLLATEKLSLTKKMQKT